MKNWRTMPIYVSIAKINFEKFTCTVLIFDILNGLQLVLDIWMWPWRLVDNILLRMPCDIIWMTRILFLVQFLLLKFTTPRILFHFFPFFHFRYEISATPSAIEFWNLGLFSVETRISSVQNCHQIRIWRDPTRAA